MIEIFGSNDTSEYHAATRLRTLISEEWPDVSASEKDRICIIPAVKCFGQKVQDIDLLVVGRLHKPIKLPNRLWMKANDQKLVLSFVLAIEVKAHRENSVVFEGGKVFVKYAGSLKKDASEQSHKQRFAALEYMKSHLPMNPPNVVNLIWLTSYPTESIPKSPTHNVLGAGSSWADFLCTLTDLQQQWLSTPDHAMLQAFPQKYQDKYIDEVISVFTKKVSATPTDRLKVERITKKIIDDQQYAQKLGEQLLVFRGRGGTGKTIRLIRIAYALFEELQSRTVLLTYNLTLVSDIKRTLAIIGVPTDSDGPVMRVLSVQKFMLDLMKDAGIIATIDEDALDKYDSLLLELIQLVDAFDANDKPDYDFVLIDEAQDWPEAERDIVFKMFGPQRCIVADGVDQLTRSARSTDWTSRLKGVPHQVVPLRQSLRLKASLAEFVNEFAAELDVPGWRLQVNNEISGGRVTIVIGSLRATQKVLDEVFSALSDGANRPIDSLVCVPNLSSSSHTRSILESLRRVGIGCWDGTVRKNRTTFPTDVEETRMVTYDSCRGLEGWSVVCVSLDRLFDIKEAHFSDDQPDDLYVTQEQRARRFAAAWIMIPLTRAMDHLIIHIENPEHLLAEIAMRMESKFGGAGGWFQLHRMEDSESKLDS